MTTRTTLSALILALAASCAPSGGPEALPPPDQAPVGLEGLIYEGAWESELGPSGDVLARFLRDGVVSVDVSGAPCMGTTEGTYEYDYDVVAATGELRVNLEHPDALWEVRGEALGEVIVAEYVVLSGACEGDRGQLRMSLVGTAVESRAEPVAVEVLVLEDGTTVTTELLAEPVD